jgi:hypothetical protein
MTYRFVGSNSDIGDSIRLIRFGQSVELSDEQARNAVLGGCALVPDEAFTEIGFTNAELSSFASVGSHERAPAEFIDKKRRALMAAHELRERFEGGGE